jgi:signal transduction histidine kinase
MVLVVTVAASFIVEQYQVALHQSAVAADRAADQSQRVLALAFEAQSTVRGNAIDPSTVKSYDPATLTTALDTLTKDSAASGSGVDASNAVVLANDLWNTLSHIQTGVADGTLTPSELNTQLGIENQQMIMLQNALNNIQNTERDIVSSKNRDAARLQDIILPVQIIGLLVGVIGGVTAMVLFVRSIVRRIGEVDANARRLGVSEALLPITPAHDEVGHLAEELRQTSTLLTQRSTDLVRAHTSAVDAAAASHESLSRMNHELRTPLTAVMGFGQMIDKSELHDQDAEAVEQILHGGSHMLRIIEEANTAPQTLRAIDLDLQAVEVGPLVGEVQSLLTPLSASRHLTVTGCGDGAVWVLADYHRFKQVLINLMSNAVKYNRDSGSITVACGPEGNGTVRVSVSDTGDGIPAEMMDRVFVPFDRLDAVERGVEGTGIGLSLSRTFVEAMDGAIGVESTVGTGSTFWVELPSAPAEPGSTEARTG